MSRFLWIGLLIIIGFVALVRIRLLQVPLERDEGEFAYAGQLLLEGVPPYKLFYNMKLPGMYAVYAGIMGIFGQTISGIHLGFLLVNAATIALVFLVGSRLLNPAAALIASAVYGLMSLSPAAFGLAAHATQAVTLAALAGLLALLRARESGRCPVFFTSGLLFGCAFLMKQPGIFFGLFGSVVLVRDLIQGGSVKRRNNFISLAVFLSGLALPFAATCLLLWRAGVFEKFWFCTVSYPRIHATILPMNTAWKQVVYYVRNLGPDTLFWILALIGVVCHLGQNNQREKKFLLTGLLLFSALAVCPGFYFRNHYFIVMFPALGLFAGIAITMLQQKLRAAKVPAVVRLAPTGMLILLCANEAFQYRAVFFQLSPEQVCRRLYGTNPFTESVEIARYIEQHSHPDARVAVLGSEAQIFFYSHRRSATPYIYMYDLMKPEAHALEMQQELIQQLEAAPPEYVVLVEENASWTVWPDSERLLLDWYPQFLISFYKPVGIIHVSLHGSESRWETNLLAQGPEGSTTVGVFQKKSF